MNRSTVVSTVICLAIVAGIFTSGRIEAAQTEGTFDFAIDEWFELETGDGPVTLHRVRVDLVEGRLSKSALARPHNQEYLETARLQLEYTNEASSKWKARITVRWLDEEGRVIDGFSVNEGLEKKSARKITQASMSTLRYGLDRAKTLEVEIHYEP